MLCFVLILVITYSISSVLLSLLCVGIQYPVSFLSLLVLACLELLNAGMSGIVECWHEMASYL